MYNDDMSIGSWASLHGRCTARHTVNDADSVEFSFQSGSQSLDIAFDARNLERFVQMAAAALREMAVLRAANQG
jgi:hypothetical protein